MARLKTTLPKDFEALAKAGDTAALTEAFEGREIDARGGYGSATALSFDQLPTEFGAWLIEHGADVDARNMYGRTALHERFSESDAVEFLLASGAAIDARDSSGMTPLHAAAAAHSVAAVRLFVERGAPIEALTRDGHTPLALALVRCRNIDIVRTAEIAGFLLGVGAQVPVSVPAEIARIGTDFEFFRDRFRPDQLDSTQAGLDTLYRLFTVEPVARLVRHDGVSPITMPVGTWQAQHAALWELLVPSTGHAATIQGELIRVSGRIAHETLDNGSTNWDPDFRQMSDFLTTALQPGLDPASLEALTLVARSVRAGRGSAADLEWLSQLAVRWVAANPVPVPMMPPAYSR